MFPILLKLNMFMQSMPSFVFALINTQGGDDFGTLKEQTTGGFTKLARLLVGAMEGVGLIFIVMGVISIATAVKSGEQNPEAITGAVKNIIIGVLVGGIGVIANLFGFDQLL